MRVLLHVCCGPCAIYPLTVLHEEGASVTGHFFNPNIHPFKEFQRRLSTLQDFAKETQLPLIVEKNYGLTEFVRKVAYNEKERCTICYRMRLEQTALLAQEKGFDAFTTTLLYSKYQGHSQLISMCEQLSVQYNVSFYYKDFREGWQYGIDISKEREMYRQPYCGCVYSEQERYDKSLRKG
jgi:predicted adenine nucleotide alpha hydrolase (AANH) superfamily ATPase